MVILHCEVISALLQLAGLLQLPLGVELLKNSLFERVDVGLAARLVRPGRGVWEL